MCIYIYIYTHLHITLKSRQSYKRILKTSVGCAPTTFIPELTDKQSGRSVKPLTLGLYLETAC